MQLFVARLYYLSPIFTVVIVCSLSYYSYRTSAGAASTSPANSAAIARSTRDQAYGKLPQRFEVNRGQTRSPAKFISRGRGFAVFLKETETVIHLQNESAARSPKSVTMRIKLVNANGRPQIAGIDEQPGRSNYFIGGDSRRWITGVPAFSKVRYEQVWPGVDLIWYGNGQQLEHDFRLAPGADPAQIRLSFDGPQRMSIDRDGALVLETDGGKLRLLKPVAWQEVNGGRREVACNYRLVKSNQIKFRIGEYDRRKALVIDPVLSYSTFLGGTGAEVGLGIAVDKDGATYITGSTFSADFPGTSAIQSVKGNQFDAFVLKLNPSGSAIAYATWIGGAGNDNGSAIAVDAAGNVYVVGDTSSTDFPITPGALKRTLDGSADAFVTKLNAAGNALLYSTYLGGNNFDRAQGVAVDSSGSAYITGQTDSSNFPSAGIPSSRSGTPIFKSASQGSAWAPSSTGLTVASIIGLAVDPVNANTIYAISNSGLYRSNDGGNQWGFLGSPPPVNDIRPAILNFAIAQAPTPVIYLCTTNGVYKSTDGGQSFELRSTGLFSPFVNVLVVDPTNPATIYAGTSQGAFKTINGADSWSAVNNGLTDRPFGGNTLSVRRLAIDPNNPATVYAGTIRGIFKTVDGGTNWSAANNGFITTQPGLGPDILALAVDPTAPATLYAGVPGFSGSAYKTTDGAMSWRQINPGLSVTIGGFNNPLNVTSLENDQANPAIVYAGSAFGIWRSDDGGANWNARNNGLTSPSVNALLADRQGNVFAAVNAGTDAFAAKLNSTGSALDYSTYLGGTQNDIGYGIAVDASGAAWVTGSTVSTDFPVSNALQPASGGFTDAFVTKINPPGSSLAFSTYLGGAGTDEARSIALDAAGNAYLTGYTQSANFPTTAPMQNSNAGFNDVFVTKMKADGSGLVYSTYLGGANSDQSFGVAVDGRGNAWVAGMTNSNNFPTANSLQPPQGDFSFEAFVARLNATGSRLHFSTYLGGQFNDQANGIAVDTAGNAYVVGSTASSNFPTLNPVQQYRGNDAFVAKLAINADLAIAKADSRDPVMAGNTLIYTLSVANNGPDDADEVTLSDALPSGVTFVSSSTSQGSCGGSGPVNCNLGELAANATATVTITVRPAATGSITNRASVTSTTPDLNPNNNSATQETRVSSLPSIAGLVTLGGGSGLGGVNVNLSGSQTATTITVDNGFFQFADLAVGGNITVTPSRQGYVFNPPSRALASVTQDQTANFTGVACVFKISPINRSFPSAGGSGMIAITSPDPQCPWTARSNAPWITITSAASGNGSATLTFNVAATTSSRTGSLTVAGNTFTVWQEANPCAVPDFIVTPVIDVGRRPSAMATADFNRDGKPDLAVGTQDSRIAILMGDGQGKFIEPMTFLSRFTTKAMITGDFNNDGNIDLAAIIFDGSDNLLVLLGVGGGRFNDFTKYSTGGRPSAIAASDLNGDNNLDLAVANEDRGNISVFFGTGTGSFGQAVTLGGSPPIFSPRSIAVGDFNGDNKTDIAVTSSMTIEILPGNGLGDFGNPIRVNAGFDPSFLATSDFNNDGRLDLAVATTFEGQSSIIIFLADAAGGFSAPVKITLPPFSLVGTILIVGDLNADGKKDLVVAVPNTTEIIPLLGDGTGKFSRMASYTSGLSPRDLVMGDFTGDGRADLITSHTDRKNGNGLLALFAGDGSGRFSAARSYAAPSLPVQALNADFTGDGKADLLILGRTCSIAICANNGSVILRSGDGSGGFESAAEFEVGNNPRAMTIGDFNNDNKPDVAVTNGGSNDVTILLNNGRGGFGNATRIAVSEMPQTVATGDFNNDGDADLVVGHVTPPLNPVITILLGNGTGSFTATNITSSQPFFTFLVTDVNGDGKVDLLASNNTPSSGSDPQRGLYVLLGNGNGTFGTARQVSTVKAARMMLFDFNGDGRLDIAATTYDDKLVIQFGDTGGGFAEQVSYPLNKPGPISSGIREIALEDFNSDGRPDITVTNNSAESVEILLGNGTGGFGTPVQFLAGASTSFITTGDFNGDGRPDIATANSGRNISVLFNNCLASSNNPASSVSAASFTPALAGEAIAAAFGSSLATATQAATTIPLPLTLAGTTVEVHDSAGVERLAPLFFVSPRQVNYQVPPGTASGGAVVTITSGAGTVSAGTAQIGSVAPGFFAANSDGQGVAAAVILRVKADGTQAFEPVSRFYSTQSKFIAEPIDFGPETDQLFLVLFGTGVRNRSTLFNARVRVGGEVMEVLYAGPQGDLVGLDQVNVRLTRNLAGRGETEVVLTVDNLQANIVKISFK